MADGWCTAAKPATTDTSGCVVNGTWTGCSTSCGTGTATTCSGASCGGGCAPPAPACSAGVVNGGWGTTCSNSCGAGNYTCNNPTPACGGAACSGSSACTNYTYSWYQSGFGACNAGTCTQTQTVECRRCDGQVVNDGNCGGGKPATSQGCVINGTWTGACSVSCGGGQNACAGAACGGTCQPPNTTSCNTQSCCTDNGTTCNYTGGSCDTTGDNNCGVQVSRCNRTVAVAGACGSANKTYTYDITNFGSDTFCGAGAPSPASPAFPAQGSSTPWSCSGSCGGSAVNCSASRNNAPVAGACGTANKTYTYNITNFGSDTFCGANNTSSPPGGVIATTFPAQGSSTSWTCTGAYGGSTVNCSASRNNAPINGACGTANKTYTSGATSWGTDTFCSAGAASPAYTAFPSQGGRVTWACTGFYSGTTANCSAARKPAVPAVSVSPNPVARGGTVTFSWGAVTGATYYIVDFFRDGVMSGSATSFDATESAPTAGATQTIGAQVTAYSSYAYSDASSITQATIAPVPTATISASPTSIAFNASSQLIWSSTNAGTCTITGNGSTWTGTARPAPGQSTGNLTSTQTYTITCNGQAGQVATNTVTVTVATAVATITSLTASPLTGAGTAPLNVSFTIGVGGSAIGAIHYQIDCTNNSSYEFDVSTSANPYTATNACNYPIGGTYTPRIRVTRSSVYVIQTLNYNVIFAPVTADIKAQVGASPASDGPINVPINSNFTLSWQTTGGTSCKATGGGAWQPNLPLSLSGNPLSGSMVRTMSSSTETYPMSCTISGGGTTPDTVTVNPIPLVPANFRITSAAPYIKGNTISFAWDAAPAATQYVVTFLGNGDPILPPSMPSPASATTISYTNTTNLNSLGASVAACRSSGVCGPATTVLTANLANPTPSNTPPTTISTTNNSGTGYASNLSATSDVKYAQVPASAVDQVYRLQTSGSATPVMSIVDANGNNITPTATTDIQISGSTVIFKVPANAAYFIKFTGTTGNFTYGFQRYRNVPYYQGL